MSTDNTLFFNKDKINRITSMYGRNKFDEYLHNQIEKGNLIGCQKEKANEMLSIKGLQLPPTTTFIDYSSVINEMSESPRLQLPRVGTSIEENNEVNKMLHSTIHNSNGLAGLQLPGENTSIDYTISITDNSKNVNGNFENDYKNEEINMNNETYKGLSSAPYIVCEWSEHNDFEDSKRYELAVQFEVMEYKNNSNRLYLTVALGKIKEVDVLGNTANAVSEGQTSLLSTSNIMITQLFENINTVDSSFLKYIPNEFLNEEQINAKTVAIQKEERE